LFLPPRQFLKFPRVVRTRVHAAVTSPPVSLLRFSLTPTLTNFKDPYWPPLRNFPPPPSGFFLEQNFVLRHLFALLLVLGEIFYSPYRALFAMPFLDYRLAPPGILSSRSSFFQTCPFFHDFIYRIMRLEFFPTGPLSLFFASVFLYDAMAN